MSETKHALLPWTECGMNILSRNNMVVASVQAGNFAADNQDFIVRACNAHYDLLEVLRSIIDDATGNVSAEKRVWPLRATNYRLARAAIAKAEGKNA